MTIKELQNYKRILILGHGIEGRATERFLSKYVTDSVIGTADAKDGPEYIQKQNDYDLVIKTPGIRKEMMTQKYTTATNIFFANVKNKTIGVTGTEGKSTTVTLIHETLKAGGMSAHLVGNIGMPMLDSLMGDVPPDDVFVIELSSYQLEDSHFSPHIGCFLNMYHELHNHRTYEEYFAAKSNIATFMNNEDYFFYNPDFPELKMLADTISAHSSPFVLLPKNMSIPYHFNSDDVRAVWTIAKHFHIEIDVIVKTIMDTPPLPHRLQFVGKYNDISFYNDSASKNPGATLNALRAVPGIDTILLGGQDRDFDFSNVIQTLRQLDVRNVVLFPDTHEKIIKNIKNIPEYKPIVLVTKDMKDAVDFAFKNTKKDGVCLLSPGAPSYTMFKAFPERGETFVKLIEHYEKEQKKTS